MTIELSYGDEHHDEDWGAVFAEVKNTSGSDNIFVCHTTISDLAKVANELSTTINAQPPHWPERHGMRWRTTPHPRNAASTALP